MAPWHPPLPQLSTGSGTAKGTSSSAKELDQPQSPPPVLWRGGRGLGSGLWEPVLTPSCSTGCTFHSESSRGGDGGGKAKGGDQPGLLWGGSPRELQAWQGSDLNQQGKGAKGSCPVCGPFPLSVLSSSLNTEIQPTLDISPEDKEGTKWGGSG